MICERCGCECERRNNSQKYCKNCSKEKNKEKWKKYKRNNRKKINKRQKKWRKNNPKKQAEYNKKYPNKIEARNYANRKKQRKGFCLLCLLEGKKIKSVAFHHTDYEANLGFSVCGEHHTIADKWL